MDGTVRIGIIGDFNPDLPSHPATNRAIAHAAASLSIDAQVEWLPTPECLDEKSPTLLAQFHGLWASPGSPYRSMEGALAAIRYAREQDRPFIGT